MSPPTTPEHARSGPPRGLLGFMVTMFVVFLVSGGTLLYLLAKGRKPAQPPVTNPLGTAIVEQHPIGAGKGPAHPDEFAEGLFIPPFELVDQDEIRVTNAVFRGKITVINFFFTHCPFICPAMNGRFALLADALKDVPDAQLLSFSVDPVHDTPARLREYATQRGADTERWRFLTGPKETTWKILEEGLKWGIEEREEERIKLPGGNEMSNIAHPGWFALIGRDGRVLGIYQYDNEAAQQQLVERVKAIAALK